MRQKRALQCRECTVWRAKEGGRGHGNVISLHPGSGALGQGGDLARPPKGHLAAVAYNRAGPPLCRLHQTVESLNRAGGISVAGGR